MKNSMIILTAALALMSCKKEEEKTVEKTTVEETAPVAATKYCYMQVTKAGGEDGKPANDTLSIEMELKGNVATGTFKWLPFYKDKKTGTFTGTASNGTVTAILEAQAEGTINKEELIFSYDDTKASVKFGEMVEKDGVWVYKDKTTAAGTDIQKVECK